MIASLTRRQRKGALIGLIMAGLLVAVALFMAPRAALLAYLSAFFLWSGVAVGAAGLLFVHHLTGGRWGEGIRAPLEGAARTIYWLPIFFLPVALGMRRIYPWTSTVTLYASPVEHAVADSGSNLYFNVTGFLLRAALFLGLSMLCVWLTCRQTHRRVEGRQPLPAAFAPGAAAAGLIVVGLVMSFAALDWYASLESHWYSSLFGLYVLVGQGLSALALVLLAVIAMPATQRTALSEVQRQDIGTLLFTLIILHAYCAYSQFFIIWNGNLPHEVQWFVPRLSGLWRGIVVVLVVFHFFIPFALLLSRRLKGDTLWLGRIAVLVFAARALESLWIILPAHRESALTPILLAGLMVVLMGMLWSALFMRSWQRVAALVPVSTPGGPA